MRRIGKRGQNVFGMSFGMIFSIIIIVVILVVAFIVIKHFLSLNDCSQVGTFKQDLSNQVLKAYQASIGEYSFESEIPQGLTYICFGNVSAGFSGSPTAEQEKLLEYWQLHDLDNSNMLLYPEKEACGGDLSQFTIPHMTTPNGKFFCEQIVNGHVSLGIKKNAGDALPTVSG